MTDHEGRKNVFMSASRSQFVAIGPAKRLKIGQRITFLWPKLILNRDFPLSGEIIHDHKLSFCSDCIFSMPVGIQIYKIEKSH